MTITSTKEQQQQVEPTPTTITSFVNELSDREVSNLQLKLYEFLVSHNNSDGSDAQSCSYRPIAVVTSGGTAVDIDGGVRTVENFSTGKRGAVSVEQFLSRGYIVIHLQRTNSCSPFARIVQEYLAEDNGNNGNGNDGGLTCESMGRLFALEGRDFSDDDDDIDDEEELVRKVLEQERRQRDPFLTDPTSNTTTSYTAQSKGNNQHHHHQSYHSYDTATTSDYDIHINGLAGDNDRVDEIKLRRLVVNSSRIRQAMRDRHTSVVKEKRLLTVNFRTVQHYLAKLQIICETIRDTNVHSLVCVYLAAAVSDFYLPAHKTPKHKIQSSNGRGSSSDNNDGLTLQLHNVPKMLGLLRKQWIPDAFVVSFKLETDETILRQKSERAVQKYGSHLVIGNILQTRYQQVYVLSPAPPATSENTNDASKWEMVEIRKPSSSDHNNDPNDPDALESAIVDYVVQSHFEYISNNYSPTGNTTTTASAASNTNTNTNTNIRNAAQQVANRMREKKRSQQRAALYQQVKSVGMEVLGAVLAVGLSYIINTALQQRLVQRRR